MQERPLSLLSRMNAPTILIRQKSSKLLPQRLKRSWLSICMGKLQIWTLSTSLRKNMVLKLLKIVLRRMGLVTKAAGPEALVMQPDLVFIRGKILVPWVTAGQSLLTTIFWLNGSVCYVIMVRKPNISTI